MAKESNIEIALHAQTDIGMVRHGNEDNFLVVDLSNAETWTAENTNLPSKLLEFSQGHYGAVFAVSDGMGGALAGEVASQMAVSAVRDRMLQFQATPSFSAFAFHERLRLAIEQANFLVNQESQNNLEYSGMGATFTAAGIDGDKAYFAQVGDSRCYLVRNGKIAQVTKDQSLVSQLVEAGHITEEEAEQHTYKNVILQALGAQPRVNVIVDRIRLRRGDIILLCSDGLSGKVKGIEMLKVINEHPNDSKTCCEALIKWANDRGGEDNITVLIAHIKGDGLEEPTPEDPSKGEFVPRDNTLPDEVDVSQLTFGDEDTLRPDDEGLSAKIDRIRERVDVVETQEVQATMLNMKAITPEMIAQMAASEAEAEAANSVAEVAVEPAKAAVAGVGASLTSSPSAASMPTPQVTPTNSPEETENSGSGLARVLVIAIIIVAIVLGIIYLKQSKASPAVPGNDPNKTSTVDTPNNSAATSELFRNLEAKLDGVASKVETMSNTDKQKELRDSLKKVSTDLQVLKKQNLSLEEAQAKSQEITTGLENLEKKITEAASTEKPAGK